MPEPDDDTATPADPPRSTRAVTHRIDFAHPCGQTMDCESPDAADHWDETKWTGRRR